MPLCGDIGLSYDQTCGECARLLKELADATQDHLQIANDQALALLGQDSLLAVELNHALTEAATRRRIARREFIEHAAAHCEGHPAK